MSELPDHDPGEERETPVPPGTEFRRVHRLTPLLRFWTLILAVFAALAFNTNASVWRTVWGFLQGEQATALVPLVASLGAFTVACLLLWWVSGIWWKANGFRLTEEEIQYRKGVLNTQLRSARFDRIQAVDLVESVISRIFRVAAVRVETAGGNNSVIEVAYLKRAEAEQLRRELVARTQGQNTGGEATVITPEVTPSTVDQHPGVAAAEHELVIPCIPVLRTLASAALSLQTLVSVLALLIGLLTPLGLAAVVPALAAFLPAAWNLIDRSWQFQAHLRGEVLNVSYGLADKRRQSIPLDRIHGVALTQPLLWRPFGWWVVSASVAGYGVTTTKGSTTTLLPVGSKDLALQLLEILSPLDRAEIADLALPERPTRPDYSSPDVAKWVSPLDRKKQGVTLVGADRSIPETVIIHYGRLYHHMAVIAVSHIQELTLKRGPVQRLLGLSSVQLDLVPGPVSMAGRDLSYRDGMELLSLLRQRALPELQEIPEAAQE